MNVSNNIYMCVWVYRSSHLPLFLFFSLSVRHQLTLQESLSLVSQGDSFREDMPGEAVLVTRFSRLDMRSKPVPTSFSAWTRRFMSLFINLGPQDSMASYSTTSTDALTTSLCTLAAALFHPHQNCQLLLLLLLLLLPLLLLLLLLFSLSLFGAIFSAPIFNKIK